VVVQVRVEDEVGDRDAYELAGRILPLCRAAGALCLINDRIDVALAVGADGAHVGALDLPVRVARRLLGPAAILGATAREPVAARRAVADGASYLGVGPAYRTVTKAGLPEPIGVPGIAAVCAAVTVPVVAIGGVTRDRIPELRAAGAYGAAVVGAVNDAVSPGDEARRLLSALESAVDAR
jgi:thiamine-phosphate pyrophosphorylase